MRSRVYKKTGLALVLAVIGATAIGVVSPAPTQAGVVPDCNTGGAPSILPLADPNFPVDIGNGFNAGYLGYTVTPDPSDPIENMWVTLANFQGDKLSLAPGQPNSLPSGDVTSASPATTYFLAKAVSGTSTPQTHLLTIYSGNPSAAGAEPVCSSTQTILTIDDGTIGASANKIVSIAFAATGSSLGSTATVTIKGDTGTIGGTEEITMTPAAKATFPAGSWRLTGTQIKTNQTSSWGDDSDTTTFNDVLHLTGMDTRTYGGNYTTVYTFTAVGISSSSAEIVPVNYISSGSQMKYTGTYPSSLPQVTGVSNSLSISKTASSPTARSTGTTDITYTVTVSNSAANAVALDNLVDTLPLGVTYVSASATQNGTPVTPSLGTTDGTNTISFVGPLNIPGNSSSVFTYDGRIPAEIGTFVNSVNGYVGSTVIGVSTSDSTPAQATVTTLAPPTVSFGTSTVVTTTTSSLNIVPVITGTNIDNSLACVIDPGDSICKTSVTQAGIGTWTVNTSTGEVTFGSFDSTPYVGVATITYRATDTLGQSGTATISVVMNPQSYVAPASGSTTAPDPVTVTMEVLTALGGSAVTPTSACVVDPADNSCSSTLTKSGIGTYVVSSSSPYKAVTFTPATGYAGTDIVTYKATYSGSEVANSLTITVADPADPVVQASNVTTAGDTPVTFTPSPTGTNLVTSSACVVEPTSGVCRTYVYVSGVGTWNVNTSSGALTFTPDYGTSGTTSIVFNIEDAWGQVGSATQTVSVGIPTYTVTYNDQGSSAGSAPIDSGAYAVGSTVIVSGVGDLVSAGLAFNRWTTESDGTGIAYDPGDSFAMPVGGQTLYAQWIRRGALVIRFNYRGANSGNSIASGNYNAGTPATDLPRPGKTGEVFTGWFNVRTLLLGRKIATVEEIDAGDVIAGYVPPELAAVLGLDP